MSILDWFANKKIESKPKSKRLDIPGNLWVKCINCGEVIYSKELEDNQKVCLHCGHHFRLTCKERVNITFDKGTFVEYEKNLTPLNALSFIDTLSYDDRIKKAHSITGLNEAVIVGIGLINGIKTVAAIMDFSYMGGSMGSVVGEKIARGAELAISKNLPYIVFSSSGGARMQEGVLSLMQMAKTSAAVKRFKEAGFLFISVLLDPTTGGTTASFAMLGDINISEPNALIGFAGPRVIEQTIKQKLPSNFQRSEYLLEHGMLDLIIHRHKLKDTLSKILEYTVLEPELVQNEINSNVNFNLEKLDEK